jgi:hypothetical protein
VHLIATFAFLRTPDITHQEMDPIYVFGAVFIVFVVVAVMAFSAHYRRQLAERPSADAGDKKMVAFGDASGIIGQLIF